MIRTNIPVRRLLWYAATAALILFPAVIYSAQRPARMPLHYAANGNFGGDGSYLPQEAGFNLADVSSAGQLEQLKNGVRGLVWIGQCNGADEVFLKAVQPFIGNPRVYGFYLADDPDPRGIETGKLSPPCTADQLKAESDWIHQHAPGTKTFITLMNLSPSPQAPSFANSYNPANTHIDLFGIAPYPCRSGLSGCDFDIIARYVAAARAWGIPSNQIVPLYQAFGGGDWTDGLGGRYLLPTAEQERKMLDRWREQIGAPEFDAVYSWGTQQGDAALESAPELKSVFSSYNHAEWSARSFEKGL